MPAIENAAELLRILGESDVPLAFTDLVRESGFAKSSVHNLCGSLVATGLLDKTSDGRYVLGLRLVELSNRRLLATAVVRHFNEVCESSTDLPSEPLVLAVLDGTDVVYVGRRNGSVAIPVNYQRIGTRFPAAFTATGKCLLAAQPELYVRGLYADARVLTSPQGSRTRTLEQLCRELGRVRSQGYAVDDEETVPGMMCIGASVATGDRDQSAAVAFSVVKSHVDTATRDRLIAEIRALAARITARFAAG